MTTHRDQVIALIKSACEPMCDSSAHCYSGHCPCDRNAAEAADQILALKPDAAPAPNAEEARERNQP